MDIPYPQSAILPKEIDAIEPAVKPNCFSLTTVDVLQHGETRCWCNAIQRPEPTSRLLHRFDPHLPFIPQLRDQRELGFQSFCHCPPCKRVFLPRLRIVEPEIRLRSKDIKEPM